MPILLDASDVHVWYLATESLADEAVEAALSLLSADERRRAGRFVFPRDRRDFAVAHALTRRALSLYEDVAPGDWIFEATADGKPRVVAAQACGGGRRPLAFNLSHTHGLVACAVARGGDIGIDVERIGRAVDAREIAARYFTEAETAFIESGTHDDHGAPHVRFADVWTLKEAFVKALGRGLMQPLNTFGFVFEGPRTIGLGIQDIERHALPGAHRGDSDEWAFALFAPSPDARMAVAVRSALGVARRIVARADGETGPGLEALRSRAPR